MDISDSDYFLAACGDVAYEQLPVRAVEAAYEVSESAEDFFWAIQGAILLKGVCDDYRR